MDFYLSAKLINSSKGLLTGQIAEAAKLGLGVAVTYIGSNSNWTLKQKKGSFSRLTCGCRKWTLGLRQISLHIFQYRDRYRID